MKMFEQAVPGEDALGQLPVDMRALMAITLIQAFVDSSCSDGGCIDSSTSVRYVPWLIHLRMS